MKLSKLTPILAFAVILLGLTLIFKGGEMITAYVGFSSYNTTPATVNTSNPQPTVDNCTMVDEPNDAANVEQYTLYGGATKRIRLLCTVNDENGGADFNDTDSNINGTIYYTSSGISWTTDNYQHYQNTSCEIGPYINATANFGMCKFDVWFNARQGGWTGEMFAKDNGGNTSLSGSDTGTMLSLVSINICDEIAFGTVSPGGVSPETNCTVNNYGNIQLDVQINGTNLSLQGAGGQGIVYVGSVKYNCTHYIADGSASNSAEAWNEYSANLTGTPSDSDVNCDGFDLVSNTTASSANPNAPVRDLPFYIRVPNSARGDFGGNIRFVGETG